MTDRGSVEAGNDRDGTSPAADTIIDADGWPVRLHRLGDTTVMQTKGARFTPEGLRSLAFLCLHAAEEIERDQAMRGIHARARWQAPQAGVPNRRSAAGSSVTPSPGPVGTVS